MRSPSPCSFPLLPNWLLSGSAKTRGPSPPVSAPSQLWLVLSFSFSLSLFLFLFLFFSLSLDKFEKGLIHTNEGIALGYGLSIWLVGPDTNCCGKLNLVLAVLMTVPSLLGILFYRERPPTPPSPSSTAFRDDLMLSLRVVLKEKAFIVLLCTIGPGYGIVTAIFSLVGDLASGKDYSESMSGLVGVVMVLTGLVGAVVFGIILDETKKFLFLIKLAFGLAAISNVFFIVSMQYQLPSWVVLVACGCSGFFLLALLPMCIELGVEVCYPATEGVVSGLLLLVGNLFGLIFFFLFQALISKEDNSDGTVELDSTISLWFILFTALATCSGSVFIFGDYKRMKFEARESERNSIAQNPSVQNKYNSIDSSVEW